MPNDMLNYCKEVLEKISRADATTFRKELRKAFKRLSPDEREQLKEWFRTTCVCRVPLHLAAGHASRDLAGHSA